MARPEIAAACGCWDFEVTDGGFCDPAGRLGLVFGLIPAKILAFGKSPYSQTRYRFTH